jgi:phosphoribosyl-ATP pyrophosphohydrolase
MGTHWNPCSLRFESLVVLQGYGTGKLMEMSDILFESLVVLQGYGTGKLMEMSDILFESLVVLQGYGTKLVDACKRI